MNDFTKDTEIYIIIMYYIIIYNKASILFNSIFFFCLIKRSNLD